ncbi:MAG: alpha-aminoadipate/glutamate carrier protein LysW/ArgW [Thermoprotei archaeon]
MKTICSECEATIDVPDDAIVGEIVECAECGTEYEVAGIGEEGVKLKKAEAVSEDWGE